MTPGKKIRRKTLPAPEGEWGSRVGITKPPRSKRKRKKKSEHK